MTATQLLVRLTGRPAPEFDHIETNAARHARIAAEVAVEVAAIHAHINAVEAAARAARS